MRLDGMPVFAALKDALDFNSARSRVIAENVANADTPGFVPRDVSGGDFARAVEANRRGAVRATPVMTTHPGHQTAPNASSPTRTWRAEASPDSETTIDGNAVVIEEQMSKVAETRMNYEAALSLYQKTLGLMRLAVKPPSR